MNGLMADIWQFNIELSLLLVLVMSVRMAVRKTTRVYNAYLLWMSIPIGLIVAPLVSKLAQLYRVESAQIETMGRVVQSTLMSPPEGFSAIDSIVLVWAVVVAALIMRLLIQHYQLRKQLHIIQAPLALRGDSKYPIVGIDKEDFSPAVYGFFKPKIYFPVQLSQSLSDDQINLIIAHEEQHIKQRHLWLNLVWDILVCLLWFNPLVYIARQNFRHDQELFCDYLVLNKSSRDASRAYGHALLTTVAATHSVSLLCSWKTFNQIEERIMNLKRPTSLSNKIALVIASAIVVAGTSVYSVSASQETRDQFRLYKGDNGESETVWQTGNTSYIERNGKHSVVENNVEREMTKAERKKFEQKIEQANRDHLRAEKELQRAEKQMHREAKAKQRELQRSEIARMESERIRIETDVQRRADDQKRMRTNAQREAERALRDVERDKRIFARALEVERSKLEHNNERQAHRIAALEEFELDREAHLAEMAKHRDELEVQRGEMLQHYELDMEQALQSLQEAQKDIQQSFASGDISAQQMNTIKEQLERAKRDIQHNFGSQRNRKISMFISPNAPLESLAPLEQVQPPEPAVRSKPPTVDYRQAR